VTDSVLVVDSRQEFQLFCKVLIDIGIRHIVTEASLIHPQTLASSMNTTGHWSGESFKILCKFKLPGMRRKVNEGYKLALATAYGQ
jgi:hypothetical protein